MNRLPPTAETERIDIDGEHVHRRTNPAGVNFEFGCFAAAPGAESVGEPTSEFSWFAGYTWRYSVCRGCATHLGWHFAGAGPSFHGLILAHLVGGGFGQDITLTETPRSLPWRLRSRLSDLRQPDLRQRLDLRHRR